MDRDYLLELYQTQLDDLEKDYNSVKAQLRTEQDGPTINKLNRKIEEIGQQMDERQQQINDRKEYLNLQAAKTSVKSLITLLNNYPDELNTIIQCYKCTLNHWPVSVNSGATTVEAIITELERISPGPAYTARDEFIAHLVHDTAAPTLPNALNQWGHDYRDDIDWLQLHGQIITEQTQRLKDAQPAILIMITRSDEASTQAPEDETYYQLNAWLIEDVDTYKEKKIGYHSLVAVDSSDAQPCLLTALKQKITGLLNKFIEEKERICENCDNYPEVHVFLPLELMFWEVDAWQLKPPEGRHKAECIGHDHVVVLRCADRYGGKYTKAPSWRKFWGRHQNVLEEFAADVFIPGHDEDIDDLIDVLEEAIDPGSKAVGLHVTQTPNDIEELCYELLNSGLPLAVWQRQKLKATAKGSNWAALLPACQLAQLPGVTQKERYKARRKLSDAHIGHHLSLLWDDPYLVPPKSA